MHVIRWAIFNPHLAVLDPVGDEIVSNVDVSGSASALIVLIYDVVVDLETLLLEEITCPDHQGHTIVYANYFRLSRAPCVDLLSCGCTDRASSTQCHC